MKIICLSDTHGYLPEITDKCDIILHAGDFCPNIYGPNNNFFDAQYQFNWIKDKYIPWIKTLKTQYFVISSGNHDFVAEFFNLREKGFWPKNCFYLENSVIEVLGLKIFGTPYSLPFFDWAFNRTEEQIKSALDVIEKDTDIIISHGPPFCVGDKTIRGINTGSKALLNRALEIKPKICLFGHIHEANCLIEKEGIRFVNASILDEKYEVKFKPYTFEI
jgi:Icc-related predicted phosphoesterase